MGVITNLTRMRFTRAIQSFTFKCEYGCLLSPAECENLGLCVHIPFCKSTCNFCPYCKVPYPASLCNRYIDALIQEIYLIGCQHKGREKVTSLYFGGGTPVLAANRIKEIVPALNEHFIITEGVGLELHPDNVRVELLQTPKGAGVTRISIGVQSFFDKYQKLFGRRKIDTAALAATLAAVPSEIVSMDFIFALPGRCHNDLKPDIDLALSFGADYIAIYPFIDFIFTESLVLVTPKKEKRALLDAITNCCFRKGYSHNSIWASSSEATSSYSSMTRDSFPGFGCSTTNLFKRRFKINTFDPDAYYKRIHFRKPAISPTLRFTRRQRMIYRLSRIAYSTKVRVADFQTFFGVSLKKMYSFELWLVKQFGFLTEYRGSYEMALKGAFHYHYYESFYMLSYIGKMQDIMWKGAFPKEIKP